MEEIAKTITVYVSHTLEIISAVVIGFALIKLIVVYFKSFSVNKNIFSAEDARVRFGSSVAVALELL